MDPAHRRTPTRSVLLLAALTTLVLETVRASGPLFDHAFADGVITAGATALGTYALPGVVVAVLLLTARAGRGAATAGGARRVTLHRAALLGVVLAAVGRLAMQVTRDEVLFVVGLLTVAVTLGALTVAVGLVRTRDAGTEAAAIGLATGAALSVGLQLALGTWDAVWRAGALGWLVAVALPGAVVVLAVRALTGEVGESSAEQGTAPGETSPDGSRPGGPRHGDVVGLWVLGPLLALLAMVLANPAFVASQGGIALFAVGSGLLLLVAWTAGVVLEVGGRSPWWPVAAAVAFTAGIAGTFALSGPGATASIAVAALATPPVLRTVLRPRARRAAPGAARWAVSASALGLGVIVPLLVYQVDYDVPLPVPNALVPVLAATVVGARAVVVALRDRADVPGPMVMPDVAAPAAAPRRWWTPTTAVLVLAWALGVVGTATHTVTPPWQPPPEADVSEEMFEHELRLVSWNLHYGVARGPAVDLEQIARTIEAQEPDVVALQEVSRGWVMGGGADMMTWLATRLDMTAQFAPAADRQFGNVLLSRYPLRDVAVHPLPYGAGPQNRSAVSGTRTLLGGGAVRFTSVHVQHREENTPTRLAQLETLLAAEGPRAHPDRPLVIAGDLNAEPGRPELDLLLGTGLTSAQDEVGDPAGRTSPSHDPRHRIDWILGAEVRFSDFVLLTEAQSSDHLPLAVTVTPRR